MKNTSTAIRLARLEKNLTQSEAAVLAGLYVQTLINIEQGKVIPDGKTAQQIIEAFKGSPHTRELIEAQPTGAAKST